MKFEKVSFEQYKKDILGDEYYSSEFHKALKGDIDVEGIYNDIKLPKRATTKSAGYDIYAPYDITLNPGETVNVGTGIRVLLDDDKFLMCTPRSGQGFKARIQLDNTVGIIDADYSDSSNEGHIRLKLTNDSKSGKSITIEQGKGMAQAIILQYFKVDSDDTTELRDGGFGSTSK